MCRYALTTYKPHYACFACQKTFKRRLLSDIEGSDQFELKEAKCPECGQLMANKGKDFEAPKKTNKKEWEHLKLLYSVGVTYHSCGCSGPGDIPNTSERLIAYFQDIKRDFQSQLVFWRKREEPGNQREITSDLDKNWNFISRIPKDVRQKNTAITNEEAKKYWIDRIMEVDNKLKKIQMTIIDNQN